MWRFCVLVSLVAGSVHASSVADIVPDVMPGDVELAPIPRPKREQAGERMLRTGNVAFCSRIWNDLRAGKRQLPELLRVQGEPKLLFGDSLREADADTLVLIGSPQQHPEMRSILARAPYRFGDLEKQTNASQGYLLRVEQTPETGRTTILIASPTPQGAFYGIQTLKQLAFVKDGAVFVRECDVLDWPTFSARGTKRTKGTWEYALKSNFHYTTVKDRDVAKAHFADWWMPENQPTTGGLLDATPESLRELRQWMTSWYERGARSFNIHMDDRPEKMTPETAKRFRTFHHALSYLLRTFHKEMKALDPNNELYFLPQPYWTMADFPGYMKKLRAAGGIPRDMGIIFCGPQVTSPAMPPDETKRYFDTFGVQLKGFVYDNHYRDSAFGAIDARPAALAKYVHGISPERGTATTRATRLDWAWNPEAYDRKRSLLLACRELAGFRRWQQLYDAVRTLEECLPGAEYMPRAKAVAHFERMLDRGAELREALAALPQGGLAEARLRPQEITGDSDAHLVTGLLDDTVILNRALMPEELRRMMAVGVKRFYEFQPEASRNHFVAAWLYDEDDRSGAVDLTSNANHAEVAGPPVSREPGKFGKAIRLLGRRGQHLKVEHKPSQSVANFTVATWARLRRGDSRYQILVHKKDAKSRRNYSLIVYALSETAYVDIYPVPGAGSTTKVLDDKWHHLAATYDGKRVCMYVDGRREGFRDTDKPLGQGAGPLMIGDKSTGKRKSTRPSGFAGNTTRQLKRGYGLLENRRDRVKKYGFMEQTAVRAATPPKMDGRMSDAVWQKAPVAGPFVVSGLGKPVEEPLDTHFRCAYDDENLYFFLRMGTRGRVDLAAEWAKVKQAGVDHRGTWGLGAKPGVALMIDPAHTHHTDFEFHVDPAGHRADGLYDVESDRTPQGLAFDSDWRSVVRVEDGAWYAEAAIPFKALGIEPKSGHVMGLHVWRCGPGMRPNLWSYMPRWWGVQEMSEAGHLILE